MDTAMGGLKNTGGQSSLLQLLLFMSLFSHDLEGSTSDTRTTRESTPDIKDIRPIIKEAKVPKISVARKVPS